MKQLERIPNLYQIGHKVFVHYKGFALHTQIVGISYDSETLECKYEVSIANIAGSGGALTAWYPQEKLHPYLGRVFDEVLDELEEVKSFCYVEEQQDNEDICLVHDVYTEERVLWEELLDWLECKSSNLMIDRLMISYHLTEKEHGKSFRSNTSTSEKV